MTERDRRLVALPTVRMAGKACPAFLAYTPVRIPDAAISVFDH